MVNHFCVVAIIRPLLPLHWFDGWWWLWKSKLKVIFWLLCNLTRYCGFTCKHTNIFVVEFSGFKWKLAIKSESRRGLALGVVAIISSMHVWVSDCDNTLNQRKRWPPEEKALLLWVFEMKYKFVFFSALTTKNANTISDYSWKFNQSSCGCSKILHKRG